MTDEITSADLTALAADAAREAEARGLVVLPAMMRTEADIVFPHAHMTLAQALDVAKEVGAPFIAIDVLPFDAAEFLLDAVPGDGDADTLPDHLLEAAGAHDGEPESLWVRWVAGGNAYTFLATTT